MTNDIGGPGRSPLAKPMILLDTNVLVYLYDVRESQKQPVAQHLLIEL